MNGYSITAGIGLLLLMTAGTTLVAEPVMPVADTLTIKTEHSFSTLVKRLEKSIKANKMGLVARASASRGAASRNVKIAGNEVLMVFRNDYAVRMLKASIAAGFEAPLRLYVVENNDRTASIIYRRPSSVFAPYRNGEINKMAAELDPIISSIVSDAAKK